MAVFVPGNLYAFERVVRTPAVSGLTSVLFCGETHSIVCFSENKDSIYKAFEKIKTERDPVAKPLFFRYAERHADD